MKETEEQNSRIVSEREFRDLFGSDLGLPSWLTPNHLKMMTETSGGFYFVPDYNLAREDLIRYEEAKSVFRDQAEGLGGPKNLLNEEEQPSKEDLETYQAQINAFINNLKVTNPELLNEINLPQLLMKAGYTNKITKGIHFNPLLFLGMPSMGIEPAKVPGPFFLHEAGHHAEEVLEYDNALSATLGNPEDLPEAYKGDPALETRFFQALYRHAVNSVVDMWLESFLTRRPYFSIRDDFKEHKRGVIPDQRLNSKPEQLMQVLLGQIYNSDEGLERKVDPDVFEAYQRVMESGAIGAILDRSPFENFFASPDDQARCMAKKVAAYQQVIKPEYLKLVEAEIEERKEARMQGKAERGGDGAVPMTGEEESEMLGELLDQLMEEGEKYACLAPSDDESKSLNDKFRQIKGFLEERKKQLDAGKGPTLPKREPRRKTGEEILKEIAEEFQRQMREQQMRGLADSYGVRQESVQSWNRIRERRKMEIEGTAAILADVFLDDRRKKIEYLKREGEVIPGLEYETIAAFRSGELDPDTKMQVVKNPEFLETEIEFIVDTSGSMGGAPIELSVELMVILVEAFKKVREDLAGEDLLIEDEQPFRIGDTTFSTEPRRISKLEEPLSDEKELIIIDRTARAGGGTSETGTIDYVYKDMTLHKDNIIKMIVVLSDGLGDGEKVWPILHQIEDDDEVIFLAIGLGQTDEKAQGIVNTYVKPFEGRVKNIFGIAGTSHEDILPRALDFVKKQVEERRQY